MAKDWYYTIGDQKIGPVPEAELRQLANSGKLSVGDLVWREGMDEWRSAGSIKGLISKSASSPPPMPVTAGRRALQTAEETVEQFTSRVSFLDLKFQQFSTPHLIGILFTLALIVLSVAFLSGAAYALWTYPFIKAALSIVSGIIVFGFMAICLRVFLELCVVTFRIAEHLSHLRHLTPKDDAK